MAQMSEQQWAETAVQTYILDGCPALAVSAPNTGTPQVFDPALLSIELSRTRRSPRWAITKVEVRGPQSLAVGKKGRAQRSKVWYAPAAGALPVWLQEMAGEALTECAARSWPGAQEAGR